MNGELCLLWRANERERLFLSFLRLQLAKQHCAIIFPLHSSLARARARKNAAGVIITPACVRTKKGSRRGDAHAGLEVIVGVRTCSDGKLHNNPNLVDYQICSILQYIFYILQYRILNLRGARRRRGGPHRLEPKEGEGSKIHGSVRRSSLVLLAFSNPLTHSLTRSPARPLGQLSLSAFVAKCCNSPSAEVRSRTYFSHRARGLLPLKGKTLKGHPSFSRMIGRTD